jgi:hypothetical protein
VPFAVAALAVLLYTLLHPGVRQTARQFEEEDDSAVWPKPRPATPPAGAALPVAASLREAVNGNANGHQRPRRPVP